MRTYHLLLLDDASGPPRRVEFKAASPDQAFQVARNERDGIHVELWESDRLLVRMSKDGAVWKLLPTPGFVASSSGVSETRGGGDAAPAAM
ncbi:hypothetical protein [Sphingopyxis sp. 113P3]|uniref:hypothetical protein n=1 Tax=Sphingopyxis sp. (strain 113P3) TaxID=292913 RepID=UPI0006AD3B78|nr:hypothetical protein [Sphingopyxis sp. 113P3]ALC13751.1 hypothetical protein LH20_17460 [Sphingopyxis sp. 113P3]